MNRSLLVVCVLTFLASMVPQVTQGEPPTDAAELIGALTYQLSDGSEAWPQQRRDAITRAMDEAVALYNRYAPFRKTLRVTYRANTPTADANYNGHIRFGGTINTRTALHEISHTLGVGTTNEWRAKIRRGRWIGAGAAALLKGFDGKDAVLRGDRQHFWPYGLNYAREDGETQRIRHVLLVERLCRDMGLPVFRPGR